MSTKTKCNKCLFADYANSDNSCAMGIIDKIKHHKTIVVEENFNSIIHYRCPMAFSINIYQDNKTDLGSIEDLKHRLLENARVDYYMIVILDTNDIDVVCESIKNMHIKPKFISFVVRKHNQTELLIDKLNELPHDIVWKLHNFLEETNFQETLSTILDTNKQNINYLWVNNSSTSHKWNQDILNINEIIVFEQKPLHAMFRSDKNNDGLFMVMDNYYAMLDQSKLDILSAIQKLDDPIIVYYE